MLTRSLLCWSLAAVGFSFAVVGSAAPAGSSRAASPGSIRPIACPLDVPDDVDVDCSELQVPEDHDDPDGPRVRLPFVVLRSPDPEPEPDPVVFTAGGPGYSSLESVWGFVDSPLLDERDIIVFEQRGNRFADPALTCDLSVWWEEVPGHTPCLDRLRDAGIDLSDYSTDDIVRDLVALRLALGLDEWNLIGVSYSTSVVLRAMDTDPDGVRSAVLISVKPPDETTFSHQADSALRAIEQMFADCRSDEGCAAAYPDLAADFFALLRRLNERPIELEVEVAGDVGRIPLTLDGHQFLRWVVIDQFYRPVFPEHGAAYLPLLIQATLDGNLEPVEIAVRDYWTRAIQDPNLAWGLTLAIDCQEAVPAAGPDRPQADLAASDRLEGFVRSESTSEICDAWDLDPRPEAVADGEPSDVPVLVVAGSYDPVTPPAWGRATADRLPNSTFVEFAGHGHNVNIDNQCEAALEGRFIADPTAELDIGCVATTPGPTFVVPGDFYRAEGLGRSADEVSLGEPGGVAWIEAIAFVSVYGNLLIIPVLAVLGVVWLVRLRHRDASDRTGLIAYGLAWSATLGSIALIVLTTAVNDDLTSDLASAFGPSRDLASATWLAWIAPLAGLASLALAGLVTWAWVRTRWTLGFRVLTTASAICSLAMVWIGVRWDLFTMLL